MRWLSPSVGLLLIAASLTYAYDEPKEKPPAGKSAPAAKKKNESVAEQIQAIQTEIAEKQQKVLEEYRAAKEEKDREKLLGEYFQLQKDAARKYLAIVKEHPDDPDSFPALQQVILSGEPFPEAIDLLIEHHLDNDGIGLLCMQLGMQGTSGADKLLRAVAKDSKSEKAKALALLSLGQALLAQSNQAGIEDAARDGLHKEAEEALENVIAKHADVDTPFGRTAGDVASGTLFEVRHLAVGKEVPDLKGKDLDGTEFALGDYRGKVVFLDFWAHW